MAAVSDYRAPEGSQVKLRPIAWGKREPLLGYWVCAAIVKATPPTVIPVNPLIHSRLRMLTHGAGQ
jgi:hypothetical protein